MWRKRRVRSAASAKSAVRAGALSQQAERPARQHERASLHLFRSRCPRRQAAAPRHSRARCDRPAWREGTPWFDDSFLYRLHPSRLPHRSRQQLPSGVPQSGSRSDKLPDAAGCHAALPISLDLRQQSRPSKPPVDNIRLQSERVGAAFRVGPGALDRGRVEVEQDVEVRIRSTFATSRRSEQADPTSMAQGIGGQVARELLNCSLTCAPLALPGPGPVASLRAG